MRTFSFLLVLLSCGSFSAEPLYGQSVDLAFVEAKLDGEQSAPLGDPVEIAISPDGRHAYVASSNDNVSNASGGIAVIGIDSATDELTYLGRVLHSDGYPLNGAEGVAVSPDGDHVYVAASGIGALSVFRRDDTTGLLTFVEAKQGGHDDVPFDALRDPERVVVSPDGAHVYAAASFDELLTVFSRDATTGALTFEQYFDEADDESSPLYFFSPFNFAFSPDGDYVYVTNPSDDRIIYFSRDASTGLLTAAGVVKGGDFGDVEGLTYIQDIVISPDGSHLYVTSGGNAVEAGAVVAFERDAATGALTFVEALRDDVGGVDGLDVATGIAMTPDGDHLYVTPHLEDEMSIFERDGTTGALTFVEVVKESFGGPNRLGGGWGIAVSPSSPGGPVLMVARGDKAVNSFSRDDAAGTLTAAGQILNGEGGALLRDGWGAALSPDEAHLYVATGSENALNVYRRDPATGMLTFEESFTNGEGGVEGLLLARTVVVSPDGAHVYVAAFSSSAVAIFDRDGATGKLTFVEAVQDGAGADGLAGAIDLAMSSDGSYVLATGFHDNALTVFSRDDATGALTQVEVKRDFVDGVDGLNGAWSIAVTPDERHVYVAGNGENEVAVFAWDTTTGALTFVGVQQNGAGGANALTSPSSIAVSPDNAHVYVASVSDHAVTTFSRDTTTGALTFVEVDQDGVDGVDGLERARDVTVNPDGSYVVAAGRFDNAIALFSRDASSGGLTFVGVEQDGTGGVDGLGAPVHATITSDSKHIYVVTNEGIVVFEDLNGPIPVELAGFETTLDGTGTARLTWQTASETNNAGFEIERRVDDREWQTITFVKGHGTTAEAQTYRFTDRDLPFAARTLTYRLRQVDLDGTTTLSGEKTLDIAAPDEVVLHGVFPHPVQAQATLRYELTETGPVRIEVYDLLGRRIWTLVDGKQPAGRHETIIDAGALPSGMYFYRLVTGDQVRTQRLVVQR